MSSVGSGSSETLPTQRGSNLAKPFAVRTKCNQPPVSSSAAELLQSYSGLSLTEGLWAAWLRTAMFSVGRKNGTSSFRSDKSDSCIQPAICRTLNLLACFSSLNSFTRSCFFFDAGCCGTEEFSFVESCMTSTADNFEHCSGDPAGIHKKKQMLFERQVFVSAGVICWWVYQRIKFNHKCTSRVTSKWALLCWRVWRTKSRSRSQEVYLFHMKSAVAVTTEQLHKGKQKSNSANPQKALALQGGVEGWSFNSWCAINQQQEVSTTWKRLKDKVESD